MDARPFLDSGFSGATKWGSIRVFLRKHVHVHFDGKQRGPLNTMVFVLIRLRVYSLTDAEFRLLKDSCCAN